MSKGLNKQISTKAGIAVILVVAVIFALGIWKAGKRLEQLQGAQSTIAKTAPTAAKKTKDQSCLNSGGSISTALCCGQTQDFPNNCAIGACGCAPKSSHQIKTCQCGAGKCFDGTKCVESNLPKPVGGDRVMCPMDAKLCPDGSSVGRTGSNCEFEPCP